MENADGFGVGGLSPLRVGISPQVPGAQVFGVGCLRAPEPESQPQRGGRLNKGGGVRGGGEKEQESLKVMWLIEHQQPQIRLCPFVSFSQCVDGKVTRLKAPGALGWRGQQWGEIPPECRPWALAVPARREHSQLKRKEKME